MPQPTGPLVTHPVLRKLKRRRLGGIIRKTSSWPVLWQKSLTFRTQHLLGCLGAVRFKANTIKSLPLASLARLFNCWLWVGAVPSAIALSAVTFIPKVKGSIEPGNYRPIAVGSHLVRLFHRIIASRLQSLPISKFQVAFRPTDGCGLNVTLHDAILKGARSRYHAVSLAFLDLRKAFDTASRRASMAALKLKGVPSILLDYLSWTVSNAPLLVEGVRIDTARGVKQGDPCSSIILTAS